MLKKLYWSLVLILVASTAYTSWIYNPHTGKLDYYSSAGTGDVTAVLDCDTGDCDDLVDAATAFTDEDDTPDVSAGAVFITANTAATTITDFDTEKTNGKIIMVIVNDAYTTFDFTSSELEGNAVDYLAADGEVLLFIHSTVDNKWHFLGFPKSFDSVTISGGTASTIAIWDGSGNLTSNTALGSITAGGVVTGVVLDDDTSVEIFGDADGMDTDEYNGTILTGRNCGENLAQWDLVEIVDDTDPWHKADATQGSGEYPAFGISVAACTDGGEAKILVEGVVRQESVWGALPLTEAGPVYLGETDGAITQTAPSTANDCVQIVGWALSESEIYFDFSRPYQLVE